MNEHVDWAYHGAVLVGTLRDRRPSESDVDALAAEFRQAIEPSTVIYMVLDFRHVEFFEANLRGTLVRVWRELHGRGGRLGLCHLGAMASHPTLITFRQIMTIADTLTAALASNVDMSRLSAVNAAEPKESIDCGPGIDSSVSSQ